MLIALVAIGLVIVLALPTILLFIASTIILILAAAKGWDRSYDWRGARAWRMANPSRGAEIVPFPMKRDACQYKEAA